MIIRKAYPTDIPAMHAIRLRVRENALSDPSLVTEPDYHHFMDRNTNSWVGKLHGEIAGFTMVDVEKRNLWALFVAPEHEGSGLGRALHDAMIAWYFEHADTLRLSTAPHTRAESFYTRAGYRNLGRTADGGEIIFELKRTAPR